MKVAALALIATGLAGPILPAAAEDTTTVVYVFPTSPSTFLPVAGLPSFLVQPSAPVPMVASYVVYTTPVPALATYLPIPAGKITCANLRGEVLAPAPDPWNLDKDGDGIGCEPGDDL